MVSEDNGAFIRNIAEVPWREFPNHFGGALSKPLVMPETAGSRHLDYRISMYQPMAHVARHNISGGRICASRQRLMFAGKNQRCKHDFIFCARRGTCHLNSGLRFGVPGNHVAGYRRRHV
jgi:hypothetical protein